MQARAAQSDGWRGETDTAEKIEGRVAHDLFYIENWSRMLDLGVDAALAAHHQKRLPSSRAFSRTNSRLGRMDGHIRSFNERSGAGFWRGRYFCQLHIVGSRMG
jgi:hypothetical protein